MTSSQTPPPTGVPEPCGVADRANLTPGSTLAACEALMGGQKVYTAEQVAYISAISYRSGAAAAHRDDIADLTVSWERNPQPEQVYEARVAMRITEMETPRKAPPLPVYADLSGCDWPDVAEPGSVDVSMLVTDWRCPCPRGKQGQHVLPPGGQPIDKYLTAAKPIRPKKRRPTHLRRVA